MNLHEMTSQQRKEHPVATGVLAYFPDAIAEVAHCSYVGNEQHNPGQPLHWAKEKSTDETDALTRHLMADLEEPGCLDDDGIRHAAKVAWRALANLQRIIEAESDVVIVDTSHLDLDTEEGIDEAARLALEAVRSSRDYIEADNRRIEQEAAEAARKLRAEEADAGLRAHLEERRKFLSHSGVGEGDTSLPPIPKAD